MDTVTPYLDTLASSIDPFTIALLAVKSLALLGLVAAATWLLRGASASRRHLAWAVGMGALVLLPVLQVVAPEMHVGLFDAPGTTQAESSAPLLTPAPGGGYDVAPGTALTDVVAAMEDGRKPAELAEMAPLAAASTSDSAFAGWTAAMWVVVLYVLGVLAVGGFFLSGWLRLAGWATAGMPVGDERIRQALRDVLWELDVDRSVALRWTDRAVTPLTWGVVRPVVLLPRASEEWSEERVRMVLLHEVAHVQRLDALTQALAQAACALFWFNPLAWWGMHRMRAERERACDDCVLARGEKPSTYAEHLLDIARSFKAATPAAAVSMAARSELEGRLLDILDSERPRRAATRASVAVLAAAGLIVALPLAALTPWTDAAAAGAERAAALVLPPAPPTPAPAPAPKLSGAFGLHADDFERSFEVRAGQKLTLDTDIGCIRVENGRSNRLTVRVPDDLADHLDVRFRQTGSGVDVTAKREDRRNWSTRGCFEVEAPRRFDLVLETSGGSIRVADLDGALDARTAGGSIQMGEIAGPVEARTSGGSIRLVSGGDDVVLNTSGGSIQVGPVRGSADVHTSGGSIQVDGVGGELRAVTSGGSVRATLRGQPRRDVELRTSGGSVAVTLPPDVDLDLRASTTSGRVRSDFHPDHRKPRRSSGDRLEAPIGSGGPNLTMRTSGGNVTVSRNDKSGWTGRATRGGCTDDQNCAESTHTHTYTGRNGSVSVSQSGASSSFSYSDDDTSFVVFDGDARRARHQAAIERDLARAEADVERAAEEIARASVEAAQWGIEAALDGVSQARGSTGDSFAESVLALTEASLALALVDTLAIQEAMDEARDELQAEPLDIEVDVADALREARGEIDAELRRTRSELQAALRAIDQDLRRADSDAERDRLRSLRARVQDAYNSLPNK